jgi:hypothetical protein
MGGVAQAALAGQQTRRIGSVSLAGHRVMRDPGDRRQVRDDFLGHEEGQIESREADGDDDQQNIQIAGNAVEPAKRFLEADTRAWGKAVDHRAAFLIANRDSTSRTTD